jgi:hypothetical protein
LDDLRRLLGQIDFSNGQEAADLPERVGGFDAEMDWGHLLSLGEQQRLAFVRLLLTKPGYAVLDGATSALDAANEALLYRERQGGGIPTSTPDIGRACRPTTISCSNFGEGELAPEDRLSGSFNGSSATAPTPVKLHAHRAGLTGCAPGRNLLGMRGYAYHFATIIRPFTIPE